MCVCVYRCHGANLPNVLLITLRTRRTTRRSSAVPEGVVVLEGVFSYRWTHCLPRQTHNQIGKQDNRHTRGRNTGWLLPCVDCCCCLFHHCCHGDTQTLLGFSLLLDWKQSEQPTLVKVVCSVKCATWCPDGGVDRSQFGLVYIL